MLFVFLRRFSNLRLLFLLLALFSECIIWTHYRSTDSVHMQISSAGATQWYNMTFSVKAWRFRFHGRSCYDILYFTCAGACTVSNIFCGWQCGDHWMHIGALAGNGCRDTRSVFNAYWWIRTHTGNIIISCSLLRLTSSCAKCCDNWL